MAECHDMLYDIVIVWPCNAIAMKLLFRGSEITIAFPRNYYCMFFHGHAIVFRCHAIQHIVLHVTSMAPYVGATFPSPFVDEQHTWEGLLLVCFNKMTPCHEVEIA